LRFAARINPVSLALRYLKGQRTFGAASFYGQAPFASVKEAGKLLRKYTKQDFGTDARRWGAWLRKHQRVYRSSGYGV
jgi:hypothetical protein